MKALSIELLLGALGLLFIGAFAGAKINSKMQANNSVALSEEVKQYIDSKLGSAPPVLAGTSTAPTCEDVPLMIAKLEQLQKQVGFFANLQKDREEIEKLRDQLSEQRKKQTKTREDKLKALRQREFVRLKAQLLGACFQEAKSHLPSLNTSPNAGPRTTK